ncbi:MAG: exonuclease SbcCD subunit D C-terminal domain-containing protein [Deltaproteobacteria bacterium]|nr:exonuclease SbcCD subunit D C-terminal domain-containing protein [Deltaproteobacteria bacterium]
MRLLHTSDWHLGVAFHERPRLEEQAAFLDWLTETIERHEVDALVVAGDVFDTANPPAEALSLYYRFLAGLSGLRGTTRSGAPRKAIVVGGNHDSPARLDAPREVLSCLETTVVGGYEPARASTRHGDAAGMLVPLADAAGQVRVVVAAVPFLHDYRLGVRGFDASPAEQLASMHARFSEVYARLAERAEAEFPGARLVATGHLTILAKAGANVTVEDAVPVEINRVGTLGALAPSVFDPRYAYVALGHIHRGFAVDDARRVYYSGTPLQVSAVEGASSRRVLLVDVEAAHVTVTPLPVPQRRRLVALEGSLEELRVTLPKVVAGPDELPPYVSVEVTVEGQSQRVEDEIAAIVATAGAAAPLVVAVTTRLVRKGDGAALHRDLPAVEKLTPEDAFRYAWQRKYGSEQEIPREVMQRFRALVEGEVADLEAER